MLANTYYSSVLYGLKPVVIVKDLNYNNDINENLMLKFPCATIKDKYNNDNNENPLYQIKEVYDEDFYLINGLPIDYHKTNKLIPIFRLVSNKNMYVNIKINHNFRHTFMQRIIANLGINKIRIKKKENFGNWTDINFPFSTYFSKETQLSFNIILRKNINYSFCVVYDPYKDIFTIGLITLFILLIIQINLLIFIFN